MILKIMKKKGGRKNESLRQLTLFDAIELELTGKFTFPETKKNDIHINNMIYDTRTNRKTRMVIYHI